MSALKDLLFVLPPIFMGHWQNKFRNDDDGGTGSQNRFGISFTKGSKLCVANVCSDPLRSLQSLCMLSDHELEFFDINAVGI